jgi:hypothetical protein
MNKKTPICRKCKSQCKEQIRIEITWFGKWVGCELIEAICIDCWTKGETWEKDSLEK